MKELAKIALSGAEYFLDTAALGCDIMTVVRVGFCESSPARPRVPSGWRTGDEGEGQWEHRVWSEYQTGTTSSSAPHCCWNNDFKISSLVFMKGTV